MVSFRYPYVWSYMDRVPGGVDGSGFDEDGNPVQATETPIEFICDAQTDSGSFSVEENGEEIKSNFFVSIPLNSGLEFKKGDIITDHNGQERRVVNFIVTRLARELWAT